MWIPSSDPAPGLLAYAAEQLGTAWEPVAARLETLGPESARMARWIVATEALAITEYHLPERIAGLQLLAFGSVAAGEPDLRIFAYVAPAALEQRRDLEAIPVLDDRGEQRNVEVELEPWDFTPHASVNLRYGTLCCWVRPPTGDAILTARHAASQGFVQLTDGSTQNVLKYAPNCLDGAVIGAPSGYSLRSLPIAVAAVGDGVDVITKAQDEPRNVGQVGQTYGTITSTIPHVFLLDQPLAFGDSGSLVRLAKRGAGLGLYLGSLATSSGPRGLCQGLYQLDQLFINDGYSRGFYEE